MPEHLLRFAIIASCCTVLTDSIIAMQLDAHVLRNCYRHSLQQTTTSRNKNLR